MIRNLRYLGDPILRTKCRRVLQINDEIRSIAQDLIDSMIAHNGSGLAAPQIGFDYAIFAIHVSDQNDEYGYPLDQEPMIFINPEIIESSSDTVTDGEGCMSVPGFVANVTRPRKIKIRAMNIDGKIFTEELQNWRARCVQHETDHTNGILHVDRMSDKLKKKHEHALKTLELHLLKKTSFKGDPFMM